MSWATQCREWDAIKDEMVLAWEKKGRPYGGGPTAYQVTLEQKKRMLARGEKPMEYEEILDECRESSSNMKVALPI